MHPRRPPATGGFGLQRKDFPFLKRLPHKSALARRRPSGWIHNTAIRTFLAGAPAGVSLTLDWLIPQRRIILNLHKPTAISLLSIGMMASFASDLRADDFAYMIGSQYGGNTAPFGTVDLNSGAFTLIGNLGSGGFTGLGIANGTVYTEQNGLLFSVNTSTGSATQIGGITGANLATFGSTTSGLYGLRDSGTGQNAATLFSINPQTGAQTAIGPIGSSIIGNGLGTYSALSVGSSTLYMEFQSNLYTINTATGAATQVGTTDSNGYLTSVLLFENGTYYTGSGSVFGTINIATGQISPHSSVSGGPGSIIALAPLSSSSNYYFSQLAVGGGYQTTLTYFNYSPQTVTCVTNFYSDQGTPLAIPFTQGTISTRTDVLAPGGSIHDQSVANLSAAVSQGWAQGGCSGPVEANVLYRFYTAGVASGEASVGGETAPTTEFATFAQTATGVAYANPSTTQSATITITAYNAAGSKLGSQVITLGPLAHGAANIGPLLGLSNFTGGIKITSTMPIISLSLNAEAFPVFSSLPPGDLPASTPLVP